MSLDDEDVTQLSVFAPLSAVAADTVSVSPWHEPLPAEWSAGDIAIEVKLAPPPAVAATAPSTDGQTRRETKDALRRANAAAARDLARRIGLSHARVNAELNRQIGLRRIAEATVGQLEERLEQADRWLARTLGVGGWSHNLPPGTEATMSFDIQQPVFAPDREHLEEADNPSRRAE